MPRTITLKLSDDAYKKISVSAKTENRSIANFIITKTLKEVEESFYTDPIETSQILSDKALLHKLRLGHADMRHKRGKPVG